jgi:hypothetical protein
MVSVISECAPVFVLSSMRRRIPWSIARALAVEGPAIVDATVAASELPKVPHLDLELLGEVARAKIEEAVLAVTGS